MPFLKQAFCDNGFSPFPWKLRMLMKWLSGVSWCRASWKHLWLGSHLEPACLLMSLYHNSVSQHGCLVIRGRTSGNFLELLSLIVFTVTCLTRGYKCSEIYPPSLKCTLTGYFTHSDTAIEMYKIYLPSEQGFPVPGVPESKGFGKYNHGDFQYVS